MSKSIRVDEDTHRALAALKTEDETFDELLTRLLRERRVRTRRRTGPDRTRPPGCGAERP